MSERFRIAVVDSGPAGLSAAAHAAKLGHLSDTIYKYQKGKHVMATPSQLVLRAGGGLEFEAGKRETILGTWDRMTAEAKVNVRLNAEIESIAGTGDPIPGSIQKIVIRKRDGTSETKALQRLASPYKLSLTNGDEVIADTVIMAIGTQDNPNLMGCPGGNLPHVQYQLDDLAEYNDEHIFVIGGGDAVIENALGLAADAAQGNIVTLVNRSAEFSTAKEANFRTLLAARDAGRINIMTETTTREIAPQWVALDTRHGEVRSRCDRMIARMGSAPPARFRRVLRRRIRQQRPAGLSKTVGGL